ncbi:MAG: DNA mismatch repair protein MutS, partial [Bacillota bacterium]
MLRQYREMKERYPDCILFFRLGDFYEMFFDDAVVAARILDITLTSREAAKGERVPMCGVPYHSAEQYLVKLVEAGYRVAICEQVEDPKTAKGLVRREVVRVVTPGTLFEGSSGDESRYVAALDGDGNRYGLAYADVSTGEFVIAELDGVRARDRALDELARLQAAECLLGPGLSGDEDLERALRDRGCALTRTAAENWRYRAAAAALAEHFGVAAVEQAEAASGEAAVAAGGALLAYLRETQKVDLRHLDRLRTDPLGQWLSIDAGSRRNLELVRRLRDGSRQGTLLWVLDQTLTAMGGRLLRQWIERPLVDRAAIEARLDAVEALVSDPFLRDGLRRLLDGVHDLPRLIARVGYQQANARDLLALARSLERLRPLRELLTGVEAGRLGALR